MTMHQSNPLVRAAVRLFQAGDSSGADAMLRDVLTQRKPDDLETLGAVSDAYYAIDRFPEAMQCVRRMQELHETRGRGDFAGVTPRLQLMGRWGEALEWLQRIAAKAPGRADVWLEAASIRLWMGDRQGAAEFLETALRMNPAYAEALSGLHQVRQAIRESDWRQGHLSVLATRAGLDVPGPVLSGPFKGMRHVSGMGRRGADYAWAAQRIGSYEEELHGAVERLLGRGHDVVVNIGAGSGYYAVGFAWRNRRCRVLAFEAEMDRQAACRETAEANAVADRVQIAGTCSLEDFLQLPVDGRILILCDCEGCEVDLLRPSVVPMLERCDILCETHDFMIPHTTQRLSYRFSPTHIVSTIPSMQRSGRSYRTYLPKLTDQERDFFTSDFRPPGMTWLLMHPRECRACAV
jgi:tetratricopeptide (TPR) repeat protein